MSEQDESKEPFMCVNVDDNERLELDSLSKKFDALFPDRIIRLIINGTYSPYFYIGKSKWVYKVSQDKKYDFTCKVSVNEPIFNFLKNDQLALLDYLKIDLNNLKVIRDIFISDKQIPGILFSTGIYHLIDQSVLDYSDCVFDLFKDYFNAEVEMDLLNSNNNGMILFKTKNNIFGDINDQSNTKTQ